MTTITIDPAQFEHAVEDLFLLVKNDRPFTVNEVIEVSVQKESIHDFKETTQLFRIKNLMKYHPGMRNSYIVVALKKYKAPAWVIIRHYLFKIIRFFLWLFPSGKVAERSRSNRVSIRPIPNNRSDSAFRTTQPVRTKKGKVRNLKLRSKKI